MTEETKSSSQTLDVKSRHSEPWWHLLDYRDPPRRTQRDTRRVWWWIHQELNPEDWFVHLPTAQRCPWKSSWATLPVSPRDRHRKDGPRAASQSQKHKEYHGWGSLQNTARQQENNATSQQLSQSPADLAANLKHADVKLRTKTGHLYS